MPSSTSPSASSLHSLQTLEKDCKGFTAQLNRLSDITGCSVATHTAASSVRDADGRLDWALRWLLNKLRASTDEGSQARSSTQAWTLLTNVLGKLEPSLIAPTLVANKFLSIIEQAAEEARIGQENNLSGQPLDKLKNGGLEDESLASAEHDQNVSTKASKKRKRGKDVDSSVAHKKRRGVENENCSPLVPSSPQSQTSMELLCTLDRCLHELVQMARNTNDALDDYSRLHIRSALHTDSAQAARLLGQSLVVLLSESQQVIRDPNAPSTAREDNVIPNLDNALYIWNTSITLRGASTSNTAVHFAEHCLLPASRFLAATRWRKNHSLPLMSDQVYASDVERLLAKHIFIPSKAAFRDINQRASSAENAGDMERITLSNLLAPLREQLKSQYRTHGQQSYHSYTETVPILFDVAIRCSSLSNPKRKTVESPWIQAVFSALTSCLGLDGEVDDLVDNPAVGLEAFEKLLNQASQNKMSFRGDFIEKTAISFIKLKNPYSSAVRWPIISHLLTLSPDTFVPSRSTSAEVDTTKSSLVEQIFSAITEEAWLRKDWTKHASVQTISEEPANQLAQRYVQMKTDVIIPLLGAYVSGRDLRGFILQWQKQLQLFMARNSEAHDRISVWQDQDLDDHLSIVLGSALTARHNIEITRGFIADLELDDSARSDEAQTARVASRLHLINAILRSSSLDLTEKGFHALTRDLLQRCVEIVLSARVKHFHILVNAWKLLSTCHRLMLSVADLETTNTLSISYESLIDQVIARLKSLQSLHRWDMIEETLQAVESIGSMLDDLRNRCSLESNLSVPLSRLLSSIQDLMSKGSANIDVNNSSYFASVISKYPILLNYGNHEDSNNKPSRIPLLEAMLESVQGQVANTDAHFWNSFVHRMEDEAVPAVEEMLKRPSLANQASSLPTGSLDHVYLAMQPNMIPRPSRERLLDQAVEILLNRGLPPGHVMWAGSLSLMLRLSSAPAGSALINNSAECLWNIADSLDEALKSGRIEVEHADTLVHLFTQLTKAVLGAKSSNSNVARNERYLVESFGVLKQKLNTKSLSKRPALLGFCIVFCNLLSSMEETQKATLKLDDGVLIELCQKICRELEKVRKKLSMDDTKLSDAAILVEAVSNLTPDLVLKHRKVIENTLDAWNLKLLVQNESYGMRMASLMFIAKTKCQIAGSLPPSISDALMVLGSQVSPSDRKIVHTVFLQAFQVVDQESRKTIIDCLLPSLTTQAPDPAKTGLLYTLVSASRLPTYSNIIPISSIPTITITIAEHLPATSTYEVFHHQSAILVHLLRHHSQSHSQLSIDTTLLALSTVCSPIGPSIPKHHGPHVFSALAKILQALLTHHRRALRGRFDLLTLSLQCLLRCLFTPTSSPSGAPNPLPHLLPHWSPTNHNNNTFSATHASLYARLLTTLCDPTLNSVRGPTSSSKSQLTDATKKARNYAGQYVPLVLMELCRCLLVGRLGGGGSLREALLPGVWAVFGIVDRGVLTAVVEGMPAAERSVLRGLREEWRRVGGGAREGKRG